MVADAARMITGADILDGTVASRDLRNDDVRSRDVKDGTIKGRDVKDGSLRASDFAAASLPTGPSGAAGATGPTGATGARGARGPQGVVAVANFAGPVLDLAAVTDWQFAGPTATVTTTATQRLVAAAMVPLGVDAGSTSARFDLCSQSSTGGAITNFSGLGFSEIELGTLRSSQSAAGSRVPGAGTWRVGACVLNTDPINDNSYLNGWVQIVNNGDAAVAVSSPAATTRP